MTSTVSTAPTWMCLTLLVVTGCSGGSGEDTTSGEPMGEDPAAESQVTTSDSELAGTSWEMVQIQSMDDNAWSPEDPTRYTLTLEEDGSAHMQLDCNQGRTTWTSTGAPQIGFGPVASTMALCPDDGLSERYAAQFEFVRSYVMRDGHLFLATQADGAIIEFRPAGEEPAPEG